MTLPKRFNGGMYPVLQPLRQAAQNARPLGFGAFGATGIEGLPHADPILADGSNDHKLLPER